MCGECWSAAAGAPTAVVAARIAWVGYRGRIPFVRRRHDARPAPAAGAGGAPTPAADAPPR